MKLRFGEFPDHHFFLLITRPFVEWSFKVFGWVVITATVQFAYEKTRNPVLLWVIIFLNLLLLGFVGAFADWIISFRRYKNGVLAPSREESSSRVRRFVKRLVVFLSTIALVGAANISVSKILDALLEFQQLPK